MTLSEHEKKVLEDLERDLYNSESDILARVTSRPGLNPRLIVFGSLVALLGVGVLAAGVLMQLPLAALFGFAIMFTGVFVALKSRNSRDNTDNFQNSSQQFR